MFAFTAGIVAIRCRVVITDYSPTSHHLMIRVFIFLVQSLELSIICSSVNQVMDIKAKYSISVDSNQATRCLIIFPAFYVPTQ